MGEGEEAKGGEVKGVDKCRIAWQVAIEEALSYCGDKEQIKKELGQLFGFSDEEVAGMFNPGEVPELTKDVCYDFRGIRRWVMLRTWDIFEKEKVPFATAIRRAWKEAKEKCAELGAYI